MLLICAASNGNNLALAERFAGLCAELGVPHELLDVVGLDWPLYSRDQHQRGIPGDFDEVAARFHRATAYLVCAPEYNGSIPPAWTSLVAWLSVADDDFRTLFNGKPAAIASHSGGGGTRGLTSLRIQLAHLGSDVLGREFLCNRDRGLNEDAAREALRRLIPAGS